MTMKERIKTNVQIERENEQKQKAWAGKQLRSYYTIEYRDGDGIWKLGLYRIGYGRIKTRIFETLYRTGGFQTRVIKETF